MDYNHFIEQIQKLILKYLPEQYQDVEMSVHNVTKNNNTELTALLIHRQGETVSPQVYLEPFFSQYQQGKEIEKIAKELAASYLQNQDFEIPNVIELVSDFEKVQALLRLQIVNKEYNNDKMSDTPHRDVENTDLTAVLRIHLPTQENGETTILISDEMLSGWGKSMDAVYPLALQNTMKTNPARIDSMLHIAMTSLNRSMGYEVKNYHMEPYDQYVLCNASGMNGATVLLYPNVLDQLAQEANANLFILPSSIHECILMQDTGELDAKELQAMVMSVNQSEVPPEERLSDAVYYYDKDEHSLSMATNREETKELKEKLSQAGDINMECDMDLEREE
ncbi:DUF5688 family protein [Enterocloster sp. OA13]|uniref:DUF5688 family protein n=1 Tax=Enterocloster sp. OA13 TaxID=2914161 RepID=UPI00047192A4|nr:DUF5688 family protein [Enterocloster sp. OA13]